MKKGDIFTMASVNVVNPQKPRWRFTYQWRDLDGLRCFCLFSVGWDRHGIFCNVFNFFAEYRWIA